MSVDALLRQPVLAAIPALSFGSDPQNKSGSKNRVNNEKAAERPNTPISSSDDYPIGTEMLSSMREDPHNQDPLKEDLLAEEPAVQVLFTSAQSWQQQAHQTELLCFEQEQALGRLLAQAQSGTVSVPATQNAERARQTLILANLRLVGKVARQYQNDTFGFDDLVQEGTIGLIQAVDRFDYRMRLRFSTYALWWIRQAMLRAMADRQGLIRVPVPVQAEARRLARERQTLGNRLGRTPTHEELAQHVGITEDKVIQLLKVVQTPVSLDTPVGQEQDTRLADMIPASDTSDPYVQASQQSVNQVLQAALQTLTQLERDLLVMRYGLNGEDPRTLEELSRAWKKSRERLRQMEMHALQKLRRYARLKSLAPGSAFFV